MKVSILETILEFLYNFFESLFNFPLEYFLSRKTARKKRVEWKNLNSVLVRSRQMDQISSITG